MALPAKDRQSDEWLAAIEALLMAAEGRGPMMARAHWCDAGIEPSRRARVHFVERGAVVRERFRPRLMRRYVCGRGQSGGARLNHPNVVGPGLAAALVQHGFE